MKRKLLPVFLALCMTLTLVPAASAHWVANSDGAQPADAKFKVEYYNLETKEIVETRYFNNVGNDDWGGEDGSTRDHFWDPITVMGDDEKLSGCTVATITLFDDITLTDTTILVAKGHNVVIVGNGHKITCTLTGAFGGDPGSAHVAGQDAISIASDNESNRLILRDVTVEIKGPQADGTTAFKDTQGIYNDGELQLYENAKIMINGVSQNGINGSGILLVYGGAMVDVKNVGGSGIKGDYVSVSGGAAVTVSGTEAHGIIASQLGVDQASVTTEDTNLYGISAEIFTLGEAGSLSAACASDAKVPAPIRVVEYGEIENNTTINGTVWADNLVGDGSSKVDILTSAASIGNTKYATLEDAVNGASENDTIQLLRDVTLTEKLTIDKAIILDGNGKTITGQKDSSNVYIEITGGDVAIQDLTAKDFGGSAVVTQGDTNLTITGCTFGQPGAEVKNGVSVNTGTGNSTVTMQNTTIAATDTIVELTPDTGSGISMVNIESGYYTGGFKVNPDSADGNGCKIEVSGGYFTVDPTAYIAKGKAAVAQTNVIDGVIYYYTIDTAKVDVPTDIVTGAPSVTVPAEVDIETEDVTSAIKNSDTIESLAYAAMNMSNDASVVGTQEQAKAALQSKHITPNENDTVTVVVEPYLDVEVKSNRNGVLELEIEALYNVKATTDPSNMQETGTFQNTVTMKAAQPMNVTTPITISVPLPEDFDTIKDLWVKHIKESGKVYYYQGKVSAETQSSKRLLTFVNPKGFSSFEIMSGFTPVASIGDVNFASLQDAINDVSDGGTIKLLANDQTATVSQEISFKVDLNNFTANITAGFGYTMSVDKSTNTYTFTKKASTGGGGGGTSTPTYTITTGSTSNGTVTVNPKNPTKGSTVTVNVTPNDGYQLDTLTVTDANGKNVEVKKKTDTEYTFTMPASKVTVSAVFVEIPEEPTPSVPQFTDVSEGAWYYDAVRYVCEKGMMNGVAEGTFAPNSTTDRAMLVTILYRLENEPATSGSSFADVPSGQWYTDAVAWAAENGIVNGVTATTFAPNRPITREQMAAILYRYAAWKGCDVSGQVDLSGYTDADSVSTYAKEALAWANAEGLITGVTGTTLRPAGSAVRAQAATILMRLCENVLA